MNNFYFLTKYNKNNGVLVSEVELENISDKDVRKWFGLARNKKLSGPYAVTSDQQDHLNEFADFEFDKYNYFVTQKKKIILKMK